MKILIVSIAALFIAACQHQPETQTVVVPEQTNFEALYLSTKAQLDAAKMINEAQDQARDEVMRQLQIQYWKDTIQLMEWQRNTGARLHRVAP